MSLFCIKKSIKISKICFGKISRPYQQRHRWHMNVILTTYHSILTAKTLWLDRVSNEIDPLQKIANEFASRMRSWRACCWSLSSWIKTMMRCASSMKTLLRRMSSWRARRQVMKALLPKLKSTSIRWAMLIIFKEGRMTIYFLRGSLKTFSIFSEDMLKFDSYITSLWEREDEEDWWEKGEEIKNLDLTYFMHITNTKRKNKIIIKRPLNV